MLQIQSTNVTHRVAIRLYNLLLAILKLRVSLANSEQALHPVVYLCLFRVPSGGRKGIVNVVCALIGKTAGEISPIIRIYAAFHRNLIARIDDRHATESKKQCKCKLEFIRAGTLLCKKAFRIVTPQKCSQTLRMGIQRVLPKQK